MNNTRVIQTSRSADLITFKVLVEGEEVSRIHQVTQIAVHKEVNRIPTATIVLLDGDGSAEDFPLSNEELFIPGKEIEITAGYHSDEETLFKGIVIKHSIKIRRNSSYLTVECKDVAVKMTVGRRSAYFFENTDAEVMETLVDRYSITHDIEATEVNHPELVQYHTSDWDFMVTRAQANGKLCFVDDGEIIIKAPDLEQDTVETVTFGATLLDFDAEIDCRTQVNAVNAYGWNPADQEALVTEGENPTIPMNGDMISSDLAAVIGLNELQLKHFGKEKNVELQTWGNSKFLFQQMAQVRGRVRFQGIPTVKPGVMLELLGVGNRFNGKVFVSGVRHSITEGNWTVDAQFGLNPEWFSETYDIGACPAAGLTAAVSGLQIGIVQQLEEDPNGEDRVLVHFPMIKPTGQGIWCRVATLDAGENRGSFFRPEISDEVIVGFINDDPNHAVILGMLHSSAKPAPLQASDDNHEKGFITRSAMRFLFHDEKKSVTLETPVGKRIVIDEDAGNIRIEDENGNTITLDSEGISLEAQKNINIKATQDVNIEGLNVNISANANFKAEGTAGAELSASATTVVKGAIVQIN